MRSSTLLFLHWLHCFIDILYHVPVSSSCFICFNFNFAYTLLKQNIYLCVMPLSRGRFNKFFRSCQIGCPRLFKPWGDLISWRGHGTPLDTVSKTCNFLYSKEFPIYQNYFRGQWWSKFKQLYCNKNEKEKLLKIIYQNALVGVGKTFRKYLFFTVFRKILYGFCDFFVKQSWWRHKAWTNFETFIIS